MTTHHWFRVQVALIGEPSPSVERLVPVLHEELQLRPHLKDVNISLDRDRGAPVVEVSYHSPDSRFAALAVKEEIFEVSCALLEDFKSFRVELIEVVGLPRDFE